MNFGKLLEDAWTGFRGRISTNAALDLTGERMLNKNVTMLRQLKAGLESGDETIAQSFLENHKMDMDTAFNMFAGEDGKGFTAQQKIDRINEIGSMFNGDIQFAHHSDSIRMARGMRNQGSGIGAEGFTKTALNYYGLQDLRSAKKLGWNKETMKTAGVRYGATAAGIWGVGKVAGGIFGGED